MLFRSIECLPDEIPEQFDVNVVELTIGQNIRVSEIPLSGSMKLLSAFDAVVSHVVAVKEEVAATPEIVEAVVPGTEPEVIKKGKKEEEAGAEAAPPAKKK